MSDFSPPDDGSKRQTQKINNNNNKRIMKPKQLYLLSCVLISLVMIIGVDIDTVYAAVDALKLQVPIGKTTEIQLCSGTDECGGIGNYISTVYTWGLSVVGILAVVMMMIGGLIWTTAGGSATHIATAKQYIGGAISGLVLLLVSYLLLETINPELVNLKPLKIVPTKEVKQKKADNVINSSTVCNLDQKSYTKPADCQSNCTGTKTFPTARGGSGIVQAKCTTTTTFYYCNTDDTAIYLTSQDCQDRCKDLIGAVSRGNPSGKITAKCTAKEESS